MTTRDEESTNKEENKEAEEKNTHQAEVEELESRLRKAEEDKIRAEAKLDAISQVQAATSGQGPQVTDEQWRQYEENTGLTRQQIMAQAQVTQAQIEANNKKFMSQVSQAEEKAKKAEERLAKLELERNVDKVKDKFLRDNPALSRYSNDMDAFLSKFPDQDRTNPDKLKELLGLAATFVKGKVGEKMFKQPNDQGSGPRLKSEGNTSSGGDDTEVDTSDLKPGQAHFVKSLVRSKDEYDKLESHVSDSKHGIEFSGKKEWEETKQSHLKQFGKF